MLRFKKHDFIHNLVNTDTKKMLQNNHRHNLPKQKEPITRTNNRPTASQRLCNILLQKIQNKRKLFKGTQKYTPKPNETPHLEGFSMLTDEEIYKTILGMPSRSCELNTIPTTFIKQYSLSTINSKNSQPLTSHRRILQ